MWIVDRGPRTADCGLRMGELCAAPGAKRGPQLVCSVFYICVGRFCVWMYANIKNSIGMLIVGYPQLQPQLLYDIHAPVTAKRRTNNHRRFPIAGNVR